MRIDDLYKKELSDLKTKTPNGLWEKLNSRMDTCMPQTDIPSSNFVQSVFNAVKSASITTKTIFAIGTVALAGTAAYMALDKEEPLPATIDTSKQTIQRRTPDMAVKNDMIDKDTITVEVQKAEKVTLKSGNVKETLPYPNETLSSCSQPMVETFEPKTDTVSKNAKMETKEEPIQKPVNEIIATQERTDNMNTVSQNAEIRVFEPDIKIPNFISPNGDGLNDYFKIKNIEEYPDNELIIFDSKGRTVYSTKSYSNQWDGHDVPDGAYFYILSVKQGEKQRVYKGNITVLR